MPPRRISAAMWGSSRRAAAGGGADFAFCARHNARSRVERSLLPQRPRPISPNCGSSVRCPIPRMSCAVWQSLGAQERHISSARTPPRAPSGRYRPTGPWLRDRVLHFATHGLLAGEAATLRSRAEPAQLARPADGSRDVTKLGIAPDKAPAARTMRHVQSRVDWRTSCPHSCQDRSPA